MQIKCRKYVSIGSLLNNNEKESILVESIFETASMLVGQLELKNIWKKLSQQKKLLSCYCYFDYLNFIF